MNKNTLKIERELEQINNILKGMDDEYHVIHGQIVSQNITDDIDGIDEYF